MNEINTFGEILSQMVESNGDKIFITCARTHRTVSYIELWNRIKRTSEELKQIGIIKDDKIVILLENSIEFVIAYFAVTQCGAVVVPINVNLKEMELSYLLEDSQAKAVITTTMYEASILSKYKPYQKELSIGLLLRTAREETINNIKKHIPLGKEDVAMLLYTSGTTGSPKGVILSYHNLLSKAVNIRDAHHLDERDISLCVLPWFHINGLVITLITPLLSGGQIIIGGKFSVRNFWDDIAHNKATWFSGVPTMYSHLLAKGIPKDKDFSSLRFARSASSPLPEAILQDFERECGVPVIESYGITEGCSQITTNPMPPQIRKVGSVGLPYGDEIMVADKEQNKLPTGQSGEVLIRGDSITRGYYRKPKETEKAFSKGWFHSGDLGYLDEDGYLYLTGRIKELINRAGEKFSPREVDEVLYEMEEVELAAVVGVPDSIYGEEVAAFIQLKNGYSLTSEDVIAWCQKRIASYKVPRKVFFTDDIPQGGNGKIQRLKLVERYEKGRKDDEKKM